MHYQLHSCALKRLLPDDGSVRKIDNSELEKISDVLCQVRQLPLGQVDSPALWEWVGLVIQEAVGRDGSSVNRLIFEGAEKGTMGEYGCSSGKQLPVETVPVVPITQVISHSTEGDSKAGSVEQHGSDAGRTTSAAAVPGVQITADVSDATANPPEAASASMESEPVTAITEEVLIVTASSQSHSDGPPCVSMNVPVSDLIPQPLPSALSLADEEPKAEKMDTYESQSLYASEPKSVSKSIVLEVKQVKVETTQRSQMGTEISDPLTTSAQHKSGMDSNVGNAELELQVSAMVTQTTEATPISMSNKAPHITPVLQKLLHQCIYSIFVCVVRCPDFFKSLYRLASVLHGMGLDKVCYSNCYLAVNIITTMCSHSFPCSWQGKCFLDHSRNRYWKLRKSSCLCLYSKATFSLYVI